MRPSRTVWGRRLHNCALLTTNERFSSSSAADHDHSPFAQATRSIHPISLTLLNAATIAVINLHRFLSSRLPPSRFDPDMHWRRR